MDAKRGRHIAVLEVGLKAVHESTGLGDALAELLGGLSLALLERLCPDCPAECAEEAVVILHRIAVGRNEIGAADQGHGYADDQH